MQTLSYARTHSYTIIHTYTSLRSYIHTYVHAHMPTFILHMYAYIYVCIYTHWLPISKWIQYRTTVMVSRCDLGCTPSYLFDLCCPVSVLEARRVLRSAARGELFIPQAHLATVQRRSFRFVAPSEWNDLPVELHSLLMARPSKFYISLMSIFFG